MLPVADLPVGALADEYLGGLPPVGAGVDDGDLRPGAPLPVLSTGIPVGPAALPGLGLVFVVLVGGLDVGARAGSVLLAEGLEGAVGSRGGGDGEDFGDDAGEWRRRRRRLWLWRMVVIGITRVWGGGVAGWLGDRLGIRGRVLGVGGGVVAVGRRRRRGNKRRRRGRGQLDSAVEEVVDSEVGGEGEAALGVEAVEP